MTFEIANLIIAILGICLLVVSIAIFRLFPLVNPTGIVYIFMLFGMNIGYLAAVVLETLCSGKTGIIACFFLNLFKYLQVILLMGIPMSILAYVSSEIRHQKHVRLSLRWIYVLFWCSMACLFLNLLSGLFFYTDEQNNYCRGNLFWILALLEITIGCYGFYILYTRRNLMQGTQKESWFSYMVLPAAAALMDLILGYMHIDFNFFCVSLTFCSLGLIFTTLYDWKEIYEQKIDEIRQTKAFMDFARIRPHFAYNALSQISQMCKQNSPEASEVLDCFSEFLRKNIKDLGSGKYCRFTEELAHLENYIRIEKSRYGSELMVKIRVTSKDFMMPSLVLEQLMETLIQYNWNLSLNECIFLILVREENHENQILIKDKTVGVEFDTDAHDKLNQDLRNIEARLESYPGARWEMDGDDVHPTDIKIIIPMENR